MEHERVYGEGGATEASAIARAEHARRVGDLGAAIALAREVLSVADTPAARVVLSLALLDLGEVDEARNTLESLLDSLAGESAGHGAAEYAPYSSPSGMISDGTLAAATAATLELVSAIDDEGFERAMEEARTQHDLMLDADVVAQQALREVPVEAQDELLPSAGSPFATRTFADLLERQGHESEAETLRSSLGFRPGIGDAAETVACDGSELEISRTHERSKGSRVYETLERWLERVRRTAA